MTGRIRIKVCGLTHPDDADAAVDAVGIPFFSAPPARHGTTPDFYTVHDYWFPSMRHNGRVSIGFVGGQVVSTDDPLADPAWNWDYHPEIGSP